MGMHFYHMEYIYMNLKTLTIYMIGVVLIKKTKTSDLTYLFFLLAEHEHDHPRAVFFPRSF